jgi:hypothetical protein
LRKDKMETPQNIQSNIPYVRSVGDRSAENAANTMAVNGEWEKLSGVNKSKIAEITSNAQTEQEADFLPKVTSENNSQSVVPSTNHPSVSGSGVVLKLK